MEKIEKMEKIMVHVGVFHADDVMCVALARRLNPEVTVERVFKAPETVEKGTVVADIGFGRYDHHQADARVRESGEKYAACGLLLEDVWQDIFPDEASFRKFERDFIIPIELADNGVAANPLSLAISSYVPTWDSEESMDAAFEKAVDMMAGILDREVEEAESRLRAEGLVRQALDESSRGVVVLPMFCPWQSVLCPSHALFVVFPSNRGGYNLQVVPKSSGSFGAKVDLPVGWLEEKPEGCSFVHQGRFIAAFDTKEQAVKAAEEVVKAFMRDLAGSVPEYEDYDMQDVQALHSAARALYEAVRTGGHPELTDREECALAQLLAEIELWK